MLNRSILKSAFCPLVAAWMLTGIASVGAQAPKYSVLPMAPEFTAKDTSPKAVSDAKKNRDAAKKTFDDIVKGDLPLADNAAVFEKYLRKLVFAQLTQTDDESLAKLPDRRQYLSSRTIQAKKDDVHAKLVELTHADMSAIAKGNFHPAVRYNAMLIIANLNKDEAIATGPTRRPPSPYLPALKTMLDELSAQNQIDAVRVACLLGILRHAELNRQFKSTPFLKEPAINQISTVARDILLATEIPANRTEEGQVWMQRRALEILAAVGVTADDPAVVRTVAILDDTKASPSLRCTAAVSLAGFRLGDKDAPASGVNPAEWAGKLGGLAVQFCRLELDGAETREENRKLLAKIRSTGAAGGGGGGEAGDAGGGMSGMGGAPGGGMSGMGGAPGGGMSGMGGAPGGGMSGMGGGMDGMGGAPGGGMSGMSGMSGMGGPGGVAGGSKSSREDFRVTATRRRLKYELNCVKKGFDKLKVLATNDPQVKELEKALLGLVAATDPESGQGYDELAKQIRSKASDLEALLPKSADNAGDEPADDMPAAGS